MTIYLNKKAYSIISAFYKDKVTKRHNIPLINHIDEGIKILKYINASDEAYSAYCLHPMFQDDSNLYQHYNKLLDFDRKTIIYLLEYRNTANQCLLFSNTIPSKSVFLEVNNMLIADKVQNYYSFMKYHYGNHKYSKELYEYFKKWHHCLGLTDKDVQVLMKVLVK